MCAQVVESRLLEETGWELACVASWPKSGSTWLAKLLRDYFDCNEYVVDKRHQRVPWMEEENIPANRPSRELYIYNYRDPRDIVVSTTYFIWWHRWRHDKSFRYTYSDWIKADFMNGGAEAGHITIGWREHTLEWLAFAENHPELVTVTSHEARVKDRAGELKRILESMGVKDVDGRRVSNAVANSLKSVKRNHLIDPEHTYQEGLIVGQWRCNLDEPALRMVLDYCGDVMERLGYV